MQRHKQNINIVIPNNDLTVDYTKISVLLKIQYYDHPQLSVYKRKRTTACFQLSNYNFVRIYERRLLLNAREEKRQNKPLLVRVVPVPLCVCHTNRLKRVFVCRLKHAV